MGLLVITFIKVIISHPGIAPIQKRFFLRIKNIFLHLAWNFQQAEVRILILGRNDNKQSCINHQNVIMMALIRFLP